MRLLRTTAAADFDALRRQHPDVFAPPLARRAIAIGCLMAMLGLLVFGFWRLEFSLARIGTGLTQIAHIVASTS